MAARTIGGALRQKRGFAIVMTVLLLGLLVVVVVSLATLTSVETGIAGNTRRFSQARQNALMALNIAIGELQATAGPDQRVTARADVTGAVTHPNWTGVWSTSGGALERWLASGVTNDSTDPNIAINTEGDERDGVILVGPKTAGTSPLNYVSALLEEVRSPYPDPSGELPVGRFAWWVGDEGVKASVTEIDRFDEVIYVDSLDDYSEVSGIENRKRLAQLALPRQRTESIFPDIDPTVMETELQLGRVISPQQMSFVAGAPSSLDEVRAQFHNVTVHSRGVLADVASGGLKYDLTDPASDNPAMEPGLLEFLQVRAPEGTYPTVASFEFRHRQSSAEPFVGIAPVISEFTMFLRLQVPDPATGGPVAINWSWKLELWNPYNVDIDIGESDFLQAQFEPASLGTLRIEPDNVAIDWIDVLGVSGDLQFKIFPGPPAVPPSSDAAFLPAATLRSGEVALVQHTGSSALPVSVGPTPGGNYVVRMLPPSDALLNPLECTLADRNGNPVARYAVFPIVEDSDALGAEEVCYATIRFRITDFSDDEDWLTVYDPRHLESFETTAFLYDDPDFHPGIFASEPIDIAEELLAPGRVRKLFDYTRQQHVSVGGLRHYFDLSSEPESPQIFLIGRRAGEEDEGLINRIFDSSFFSTFPRSGASWGGEDLDVAWLAHEEPLPNTRIVPLRREGGAVPTKANLIDWGNDSNDQVPAAHVLVNGAFNLNSTSEVAWRAVLTGTAIAGWEYYDGVSGDEENNLSHAFFTLPQTSENVGATYQPMVDSEAGWRQGVRELSEVEVNGIASELMALKADRAPFRSVQEFVNSGILEDAIQTQAVNDSTWDSYSPGFLDQGDLLIAWAPFLQARSDTFLVRAYGESLNPLSGAVEGRAWCEAVVQRTPDYVDQSDDPWETPAAGSINDTLGRRFKIVQFRWLTPDDI